VGGHNTKREIEIPKYSKDDSDQSIGLNLKLKNWNRPMLKLEIEKLESPDAAHTA
jgi:hypothetical protein